MSANGRDGDRPPQGSPSVGGRVAALPGLLAATSLSGALAALSVAARVRASAGGLALGALRSIGERDGSTPTPRASSLAIYTDGESRSRGGSMSSPD